MTRGIKKILFVVSLSLCSVFIGHSIINAADGTKQSITVSPVKETFELNSGEEATRKITVINSGETDYDFRLYVLPFSVHGEEYSQAFAEAPNAPSAANWISFPVEKFHVSAGEKVEASYNVAVDKNAPSGGHYATVFAETIPPESTTNGVTTVKRIGTILYFEIKGDITRSGSVDSFTANRIQSAKPISSTLRLTNDGNVHYPANGTLTLKNVLNRREYTETFSGMVLPSTTRKFDRSWQNAKLLGLYKVSGSVDILGQQNNLGTQWIIYLPLKQVLILIAILLAIIVLAIFLSKRKRHIISGR